MIGNQRQSMAMNQFGWAAHWSSDTWLKMAAFRQKAEFFSSYLMNGVFFRSKVRLLK